MSALRQVHLDNHTATRPSRRGVERMGAILKERWGSLEMLHARGEELYTDTESSLQNLRKWLGRSEEDPFFITGGDYESFLLIFLSHYLDRVRESGRNHFLVPASEEALLFSTLHAVERMGCAGKLLPLDGGGGLDLQKLKESPLPRASFLSMAAAGGLTGVIQPVEEVSAFCAERGITLHLDVSAIVGKMAIPRAEIVSFSGARCYAPQGMGGIFLTKGKRCSLLEPLALPVSSLVALEAGVEEVSEKLDFMLTEIARLRFKLEKSVLEIFPGAVIFYQESERLPNVSAMAFPSLHGELLSFQLAQRGVLTSIGGGSSQNLSQLLQASGVSERLAKSAVSFNLSYETTEEDIDYTLAALEAIV